MLNDKEHNISNNQSDSVTTILDEARDHLNNLHDNLANIQDGLDDLHDRLDNIHDGFGSVSDGLDNVSKGIDEIHKNMIDDEISKQKIRINAYNEALPLIDKNDYKAACNVLLDAIKPKNEKEMFLWACIPFAYPNDVRDSSNSISWLKKAADLGLTTAQHTLGCFLYMGYNVSEDIPLAIEYLKSAAKNGNEDSQTILDLISKSDEKINIPITL